MPKKILDLDENYAMLIGPYANSFYFVRDKKAQFCQDCHLFIRSIWGNTNKKSSESISEPDGGDFNKQKFLCEIFLWSVTIGYSDIAFVLLLQMDSRMTASLVAAGIAKRLSSLCAKFDERLKYLEQAKEYEAYATACINICYQYDDKQACSILSRENPFFGNVTCMQVSQLIVLRGLIRIFFS